jgi:nitrogen fixation protein FixH
MTALSMRNGRYIPWLFVAGFVLVFTVNATMIWFAVGSFSGLYASKPRDRGLHYNAIVDEQKTRDALGWKIDAQWRPESGCLEISAVDGAGRPLAGARVTVELVRPAEKRPPLSVAMGAIEPGRFAGYVELPARGNWDADIVVEHGGERYALTRRMFLR